MRSSVRGSLIATALLTATLASGCGGDDGGDGGDGGGDEFTKKSADEISDIAKDAMADLKAVTVEGTLSSDGEEIEIRMEIGQGGNCSGEFGTQGATAEILGVEGTTWFKPDEAFWELFAGAENAPAVIEAAGDRWVRLPDDDTSFKPFCNIEEFVTGLTDESDAKYTKGDVEEVGGEDAIEIVSDRGDEGKSSGYILVDGDHYVVKIAQTEGEDPGTVEFSGFDEQPDVEAPADDEQVALEDLESAA